MSQIRPENTDRAFPHLDEWGLSKREYFAAMALHTLPDHPAVAMYSFDARARDAVKMADALIAALKEEKK